MCMEPLIRKIRHCQSGWICDSILDSQKRAPVQDPVIRDTKDQKGTTEYTIQQRTPRFARLCRTCFNRQHRRHPDFWNSTNRAPFTLRRRLPRYGLFLLPWQQSHLRGSGRRHRRAECWCLCTTEIRWTVVAVNFNEFATLFCSIAYPRAC